VNQQRHPTARRNQRPVTDRESTLRIYTAEGRSTIAAQNNPAKQKNPPRPLRASAGCIRWRSPKRSLAVWS